MLSSWKTGLTTIAILWRLNILSIHHLNWIWSVSNEAILATKQKFFFAKVALLQSITDIALLGFWLILHPGVFISYYTIICFFAKKKFFECFYFSEYAIRMFLFVFWLRNMPSIKYVGNKGNERGHPKFLQMRRRGERCHASCAGTHLHYPFSCFYLMVSYVSRSPFQYVCFSLWYCAFTSF